MRRLEEKGRNGGFTLLELLAVMGIMMLMAGIAVMSYFGAMRGAATRAAVSHLRNSLSFARQTAIMNRRSAYVIFERGSNYYSYVVCLRQGKAASGGGTQMAPGEYADWSGLKAGSPIYNLDTGIGAIIQTVSPLSIVTTNLEKTISWSAGDGYGWPIQEKMHLPLHFVVAESGTDDLPESVEFKSNGTVSQSGYEIDIYESISETETQTRITLKVERLTGFISVSWPE